MVVVQTPPNSRWAVGRATETTLVAVLTVVVLASVVAVIGAGVVGSAGVVGGAPTSEPAAAAGATASSAALATSATSATLATPTESSATPAESQTVVATAVSTTSATVVGSQDPVGFTLAELAAGEVSPERFDAFWQTELERIRSGPCPAPAAPGTTVVVASVGATPPAHLGADYVDYGPLLSDARAEVAAACA